MIEYGQLNKNKKMNGLCRRMLIYCYGGGVLWEGQFKDGMLNGFARQIEVYNDGNYNSYMGYWQDSRYHGYGLSNEPDEYGGLKEGLFEDSLFGYPCVKPEDVTAYDTVSDVIAEPVDFGKYGHINYRENINPEI